MEPIITKRQLPKYKEHIIRQKEVLKIAYGFTEKEKQELLQRFNDTIATIDKIMQEDKDRIHKHKRN